MLRTINLLAFVGVLYLAGTYGGRWVWAPWSMPALGPTLTGVWEGPLRAEQGAEYRLYVELSYRDGGVRLSGASTLTGRARICNRAGELFEYSVDGEASRSGDRVELRLTFADPARRALGTVLDGSWSGQSLTLRPTANPFADDGFVPAELHRAEPAAFLIGCGRLTR
ncbi:MAG: hypothetical protein IT306_23805 [Chloroflexi bacterium]|nr:hypothetical protein [Chloroflexota bacterium]